MLEKFKTLLGNDGFFYGFLLILIAVVSFGLGKLSERQFEPEIGPASVIFTDNTAGESDDVTGTVVPETVLEGQFVGSVNGTKYHFPWCPGASQMKEENKVWFATKEEAEAAGYTPAANCKGL